MFNLEQPTSKNKYSKFISRAQHKLSVSQAPANNLNTSSTNLPSSMSQPKSLNYKQRMNSQLKIAKDNKSMLERLQN